jgi:topoisomerase IA-like protein
MTAKKHKFVVGKESCSYGRKGDLVELDTDELTPRQKTMLSPYKEPEVKEFKTATPAKKTTAKKPAAKKTAAKTTASKPADDPEIGQTNE